jgi:DNA mismatch repair protein MutL
VKDQTISHAVYRAYEGILPQDKHPVFFLFLDIDPRRVDFNVHPSKREVRFENKEEMHRFVSNSLREATRKERAHYIAPFTRAPEQAEFEQNAPMSLDCAVPIPPVGHVPEDGEFRYQPSLPFIYLGDTFVATAGKGGLTLIDHHAAHERILYENFLHGINLNSHQLLFPKQVTLSHKEYKVITENKSMLHEMGIEADDFGHNTVMVRTLPDALEASDMRGILSDVAISVLEGILPLQSLKEKVAARIACHSSVRGKEILSQEAFQRLLSDLEKTENPDQCPHGRPTRLFISLDDLKKMFKRK